MPNTAHHRLFFLLATCTPPLLTPRRPRTLAGIVCHAPRHSLHPTQLASHALSRSRSCVPTAPEHYEPHCVLVGLNCHIYPLLRPLKPSTLKHCHICAAHHERHH
ncbi:hypothetical protein BD779DRAFT_1588808, partial [Infundibulicybe gibba]